MSQERYNKGTVLYLLKKGGSAFASEAALLYSFNNSLNNPQTLCNASFFDKTAAHQGDCHCQQQHKRQG